MIRDKVRVRVYVLRFTLYTHSQTNNDMNNSHWSAWANVASTNSKQTLADAAFMILAWKQKQKCQSSLWTLLILPQRNLYFSIVVVSVEVYAPQDPTHRILASNYMYEILI